MYIFLWFMYMRYVSLYYVIRPNGMHDSYQILIKHVLWIKKLSNKICKILKNQFSKLKQKKKVGWIWYGNGWVEGLWLKDRI